MNFNRHDKNIATSTVCLVKFRAAEEREEVKIYPIMQFKEHKKKKHPTLPIEYDRSSKKKISVLFADIIRLGNQMKRPWPGRPAEGKSHFQMMLHHLLT